MVAATDQKRPRTRKSDAQWDAQGRRSAWCVGSLILLPALIVLGLGLGCHRVNGNGKISVSASLAFPLDSVEDVHISALKKFKSLEATGKFDADVVTSRLNSSIQDILRERAAGSVAFGLQPATPEIPELPEGDKSALAAEKFSDTGAAAALLSQIQMSPFERITATRDIYESLSTAELRFKMKQLEGYSFHFVPITISVDPGTRTRQGFLADVNFQGLTERDRLVLDILSAFVKPNENTSATPSLGTEQSNRRTSGNVETNSKGSDDNGQTTESLDIRVYLDDILRASLGDDKTTAVKILKAPKILDTVQRAYVAYLKRLQSLEDHKEEAERLEELTECPLDELEELCLDGDRFNAWLFSEDITLFTISPLRQFDRRAESLASRIQTERAFQLAGSGPVSESASAAGKASRDRVKRLERDFATVTRQPILTGHTGSGMVFGWRFYPRASIDADRFKFGSKMVPGPRDLMAVFAVKQREFKENEPLKGDFHISVPYKSRWISLNRFSIWYRELLPENTDQDYFIQEATFGPRIVSYLGNVLYDIFPFWERPVDSLEGVQFGLNNKYPSPNDRRGRGRIVVDLPAKNPSIPLYVSDDNISTTTVVSGLKPFTLELDGSGFSKRTRIIFRGEELKPTHFTDKKLLAKLPVDKVPQGIKSYEIFVTNGPKEIVKLLNSIKVNGRVPPPPAKTTVTYVLGAAAVQPNQLVNLIYKDNKGKALKLPAIGRIAIKVGNVSIQSSDIYLSTKTGELAFNAPAIAEAAGKQFPVLVTINGKHHFLTLTYAPKAPSQKKPLDVRLSQ